MTDTPSNTPDQLVMYVLREPGYLRQTLTAFAESGLSAIEVIESQGAAELFDEDIPIFASFRHIFTGAQSYNYVIMAAANAESRDALVGRLDTLFSTVDKEQRGVVVALPMLVFRPIGGSG